MKKLLPLAFLSVSAAAEVRLTGDAVNIRPATLPTCSVDGQLRVNASNALNVCSGGSWSAPAPGGAAGGDLSGTYPNPQIGTGVIVNADINASAAIAGSKIVSASASASGVVTTGAQTLAGEKTFSGGIISPHVKTTGNSIAIDVENRRLMSTLGNAVEWGTASGATYISLLNGAMYVNGSLGTIQFTYSPSFSTEVDFPGGATFGPLGEAYIGVDNVVNVKLNAWYLGIDHTPGGSETSGNFGWLNSADGSAGFAAGQAIIYGDGSATFSNNTVSIGDTSGTMAYLSSTGAAWFGGGNATIGDTGEASFVSGGVQMPSGSGTGRIEMTSALHAYGGLLSFGDTSGTNAYVSTDGEAGFSNGSASVPSHSFVNDPNTGMYSISADILGFTTAGSERLRIDASGLVGINGAAADARFMITNGTAANKALLVKAAASQSDFIQEWQNSSSTSLAAVNPSGYVYAGSTALPSGSVTAAPSMFSVGQFSFLGGNVVTNDTRKFTRFAGMPFSDEFKPVMAFIVDSVSDASPALYLGSSSSLASSPADMYFMTSNGDVTSGTPDNVERIHIDRNGLTVVNETGLSTADVRVEGDTDANLLFTDSSADSIGIGTASPGAKLDIAGSLKVDSIVNDTGLASGTWTPTLTNDANLDGSTAFQCQYMRVGSTVTGSCRFSVNPTLTATATQLRFTLPVASNFGAVEDAAGNCGATGIAGQQAGVEADVTNDAMLMKFISGDITGQPMTCSFSYQVI